MGQYFVIVNLDKKEYIHPHKLASGLKFWEILASNSAPRALAFLLRQSNEGGGGDVSESNEDKKKLFCGSWRANRIAIIGDYDESNIYEKCTELKDLASHNKFCLENKYTERILKPKDLFKDITDLMLKEYNEFIDIPEYQVELTSEGWRKNKEKNEKPHSSPDMIISSTGIKQNVRL